MAGDGGDAATRAGHGGEAVVTAATATTGPGARRGNRGRDRWRGWRGGGNGCGGGGKQRWRGRGVAAVEAAHGDEAAHGGSTSAPFARVVWSPEASSLRSAQISAKKRLSTRAFRAFSTGSCNQPVPMPLWYRLVARTGTKGPPGPQKLARESPDLWYRLVVQPVPKVFFFFFSFFFFSHFFFPVLLKKL